MLTDRKQRETRMAAAVLAKQLRSLVEPATTTGRNGLAHLFAMSKQLEVSLTSPTRVPPHSLSQLLADLDATAAARVKSTCEAGYGCGSADLARKTAEAVSRVAEILEDRLPSAVTGPFGPAHTIDFIRIATISAEKMAQLCGTHLDEDGTAQVQRTLAAVLGERYPGHTIEVRIPPYAAVQLGAFGEGPSHHRGTPPNVVETDPETFWRLCVGLIDWEQARADHKLRVSGVHADQVSRMLPLLHLRDIMRNHAPAAMAS